MQRPVLLVLLLALLAVGCGSESSPLEPAQAAPPQTAELDWVEICRAGVDDDPCEGKSAAHVVFGVERFEVLKDGWRARVSLTNRTKIRYSVGDPKASLDRVFGLMLFRTDDLRELEQLNRAGELPSVRRADAFRPALPLVLEPGQTWIGEISARGSLAAGRYVRIVFGALVAIGDAPAGLPDELVWITDHAYRLRGGEAGTAS